MNEVLDSEDLLTRFLLDELDERERAEVEDRLLSETEFYEQMLGTEAELTDAYVGGELSPDERKRFEKSFFASRDRRKRVEFARGLADSATLLQRKESTRPDSAVAPKVFPGRGGWLTSLFAARPAAGYALAVAVLVVIGVGVWFALERMRARVEPQRVLTEGDAPQGPKRNDSGVALRQPDQGKPSPESDAIPGAQQTPERDAARDRRVFATVTLVPGSLRDGAAGANLFIPHGSTHLRVRLQLEEDNYPSYNAILSTPEGRTLWAGAARKDREKNAQFVTFTLPAVALSRGDYIIELNGTTAGARSEPAAQYSFRVTRED